jgi:hypothetical protein
MCCALDLLIPVSQAHCFADFCGRVNCSNTTEEEEGLITVQGIPDLSLCTPCIVLSSSNLIQMRAIVNHVGGSIANSCHHCLCTSHTFSNFQYHFKIILCCLNDNLLPFSLIVLPFNKVPLVYMLTSTIFWETITLHTVHYISLQLWKCLYITTFKLCIHFFGSLW